VTGTREERRTGLRSRRGILLPVALFLVLALGAVANSVLVLSRAERLVERGAFDYLRQRVRGEALLGRWEAGPEEVPEGEWIRLGGGFELVRTEISPGSSSWTAVRWRLEPDSVALSFPGGLQVGAGSGPEAGVELLEGCDAGPGRPLVSTGPPDPAVPAHPDLPPEPRVGILGVRQLLRLATTDLAAMAILGSDGSPEIFHAPAGARLLGGGASGLLVSGGDLSMEADTRFRGLVVVAGSLALSGTARLEGVALVGGTAWITEDAQLLGCPSLAAAGLDHPDLARLHTVPGGGLLGRF